MTSSTTRSTGCSPKRSSASSPSRAGDDAEAVALERIGQELLDGVLVVDEQDGRGICHDSMMPGRAAPAGGGPTLRSPWPFRPRHRGGGPGPARRSARSTPGCTAARGSCSRFRSCSRPSAWPGRRRCRTAFPPAFDSASAETLAEEFSRFYPMRFPGSTGAKLAADWYRGQLSPYGLSVAIPAVLGRGPGVRAPPVRESRHDGARPVRPADRRARAPGRPRHRARRERQRDRNGGADRARALVRDAGRRARPSSPGPIHTLVFVSTDGGALGGVGARALRGDRRETTSMR